MLTHHSLLEYPMKRVLIFNLILLNKQFIYIPLLNKLNLIAIYQTPKGEPSYKKTKRSETLSWLLQQKITNTVTSKGGAIVKLPPLIRLAISTHLCWCCNCALIAL